MNGSTARPNAAIRIERDVCYGHGSTGFGTPQPGTRALMMDVYLPADDAPAAGRPALAQVRRLGHAPEHKSFDIQPEAEAWARVVESERDRPSGIFASRVEAERTTLPEALKRHRTEICSRKAPSTLARRPATEVAFGQRSVCLRRAAAAGVRLDDRCLRIQNNLP